MRLPAPIVIVAKVPPVVSVPPGETVTLTPSERVIEEIAVEAPVTDEFAVKNALSLLVHPVPPAEVAGLDQFVPVQVPLVPSVLQYKSAAMEFPIAKPPAPAVRISRKSRSPRRRFLKTPRRPDGFDLAGGSGFLCRNCPCDSGSAGCPLGVSASLGGPSWMGCKGRWEVAKPRNSVGMVWIFMFVR